MSIGRGRGSGQAGRVIPISRDFGQGGGQEFQQQSPWSPRPRGIYGGPPPTTQSQTGPGGMPVRQDVPDAPGIQSSGVRRLSTNGVNRFSDPWDRQVLYYLQRKGNFQQFAGVVGTVPILIRKAESRTYMLLQNTSVANNLFFALGYAPQVVSGGATGFQLNANGGNFEPTSVPQEDLWLVASVAGVPWVLAVCTDWPG